MQRAKKSSKQKTSTNTNQVFSWPRVHCIYNLIVMLNEHPWWTLAIQHQSRSPWISISHISNPLPFVSFETKMVVFGEDYQQPVAPERWTWSQADPRVVSCQRQTWLSASNPHPSSNTNTVSVWHSFKASIRTPMHFWELEPVHPEKTDRRINDSVKQKPAFP